MIVFDLQCGPLGHRFEGWFGSSLDYEDQRARGLVSCPACGSVDVTKAVMAPNVGRKGNQVAALPGAGRVVPADGASAAAPVPQMTTTPMQSLPPQAVAMLQAMAKAQAEALKQSTWVGNRFADDARAMHYGEKDQTLIHGRATIEEAQELAEEGIPVAPVLFPIAPPDDLN